MDGDDDPGVRVEWELCDLCGALIAEDAAVMVLVPDSSAISPDGSLDGERLLTACSMEHLAELVGEYRRRPFVEEELWEGMVFRALYEHDGQATARQITRETGLSEGQIDRAVAWHNHRALHWQDEHDA